MKFTLIANHEQNEGFQLKVEASTPEEIKICAELTKLLIEKISVIEIKQSVDEEY